MQSPDAQELNAAGSDKENVTRESIISRHKKERRQLETKLKAIRKSAGKNKKRIEEAEEAILEMTNEVVERHRKELESCRDDSVEGGGLLETELRTEAESKSAEELAYEKKKKKAQQKNQQAIEKMKKRERQLELERAEAMLKDPRVEELKALEQQLSPLNSVVHLIRSDGNCLYRAVAHQLSLCGGVGVRSEEEFAYIRRVTAQHLRDHSDEFLPFSECEDEVAFEEYCKKVEFSSEWGGNLELRAISHSLKLPVKVWSATSGPITFGEEFMPSDYVIRLSYHLHYYAMGAHYNSVVPL